MPTYETIYVVATGEVGDVRLRGDDGVLRTLDTKEVKPWGRKECPPVFRIEKSADASGAVTKWLNSLTFKAGNQDLASVVIPDDVLDEQERQRVIAEVLAPRKLEVEKP
jgi:hypothetical protein